MSDLRAKDERKKFFFIVDNAVVDPSGPVIKQIGVLGYTIYSIILSKSNNTNYVPSQASIASLVKLET